MKPSVVADAGPLIVLAKCGQLSLLSQLFAAVHVAEAVVRETSADPQREGAAAVLAFVRQSARIHENPNDALYGDLRAMLDEGEAQTISLAVQLGCGVLMDERRGRQWATHYGVQVFGVLGVLLQAKRVGLIRAVRPCIDCLQAADYRLSPALVEAVLRQAGEWTSS